MIVSDVIIWMVYRKYNNGSVLRMHVDTVNTHVVSAIINVDQQVEQDLSLIHISEPTRRS